jgi:hypothetical protein
MDGNLVPSFDEADGTPRPAKAASPYADLPAERFWRSGVAETNPLIMEKLYRKRFAISATDRIATAGSCFAQHIARNFRARGFTVMDVERAPHQSSQALCQAYGYGVYSARYANIYTVRQLLELFREATAGDRGEEPWPVLVWEKNGRFVDGLRPGVEPDGLDSPEEVIAQRRDHLARVRQLFAQMQVFVFTMGLTEAWIDTASGRTLPTCPGTIAGTFDAEVHKFRNFSFRSILTDYRDFRKELAAFNPGVRHLITVSPVPLTATASQQHVLVATTYSKSVLRAVAGQLYADYRDVDYFPSYEIIAAHPSRGFFFEGNLRSVSPAGVETVMRSFFSEHGDGIPGAGKSRGKSAAAPAEEDPGEDVVCEEILLEAFAR